MEKEEYETIKQARIALLCIGDKVYHVLRPKGSIWNDSGKHSHPITIRQAMVVKIGEDKLRAHVLHSLGMTPIECSFESLFMHEGSLYILPQNNLTLEANLAGLTEILESDETEFQW